MARQNAGSFRLPTILCAFHPNETIQHFCHSKQCMLPLCRVCIPIHQKQHKSMVSTPTLVEIQGLMEKINRQIQTQRQDVLRKYSCIKRFYRISADTHQEALKRTEEARQKTLQDINRRFDSAISQMCSLHEQKMVEVRTIQLKLQIMEHTLELVKATFNKAKPMRTVILWQSNELGSLGSQLLSKVEEKVKNQQSQQPADNKHILESIIAYRSPTARKQPPEASEVNALNKYLQTLGSIIEMEVDTSTSNDIKKSFIKLRTSGISLTQVSLLKSETKRSKDSNILSTPQRKDTSTVKLRELGRQARLSGRMLTKQ